MRYQGRLVEWFDEKGYGFIQPLDTSKPKVFLHIKDFAKTGPRPLVGCALEYQLAIDDKGRYRAQQVQYLKLKQVQQKGANPQSKTPVPAKKYTPMQYGIVAYIVVVSILSLTGLLSGLVMLVITLINILTYWLYAQDKEAARQSGQRVPENTLHLLAFLGGWPAAWLAQQRLRHKTKKQPFRNIYFCMIVLNILGLIWLMSPFNPY